MKDSFKVVLAMTVVPLLVSTGAFTEDCATQVSVVFSTLLTALVMTLWKIRKDRG